MRNGERRGSAMLVAILQNVEKPGGRDGKQLGRPQFKVDAPLVGRARPFLRSATHGAKEKRGNRLR